VQARFKEGDKVRYQSNGHSPDFDGAEGIVVEEKQATVVVKLTTLVRTVGDTYTVGCILALTKLYLSVVGEEIPNDEAVEHPAHYGGKEDPYEVIKVIEAWGLGFKLGNVVKYVARAGKKDPAKELEDLKKGRFYIDHRIEELEKVALANNS
jgi:hypothetical protein